ncbi:2-aminoethylphosphonate--pyruvate transaminase [Roseococcus sp. YIM B11640]|uniref:2-aminoethylphosphonate--pyruvate transaminase n=1 Tax=Roseococcus sp. YIM B11640 TaxID=3133973 RepID=UPI003C7C4501
MLLLTPGPVQTHPSVRAAMAEDIAPWDSAFRPFYTRLRDRIRAIAGGVEGVHVTLPLQVAGHMIMEAAIRTYVPAGGALLVPVNGQYAGRAVKLGRLAGRVVVELEVPDTRGVTAGEISAALAAHPECSHVAMIYSETGSGIVNDPAVIGPAVRAAGRRMIVDAVSAFGALPLDLSRQPEIDAVIFTSNKCLEGLPGFSFAVARIDTTEAASGNAGSWSLDLSDVLANTNTNGPGSLRFTGPVQSLRALDVALDRFDAEGGREPRLARYRANADILYRGLKALGLKPYVEEAEQGPIVVTFHQPAGFVLADFCEALKRHDVMISSYYTSTQPSFRIGAIGDVGAADMHKCIAAVGAALDELGLSQAA